MVSSNLWYYLHMFYLIGGTPRSGKTTIAKELAKRLNIPWISTDSIESIIIEYVNNEKFKDQFPKNVMRKLTHDSNDEMYSTYEPEEIVEAYIQQGKTLEKGIATFLKRESIHHQNYILEGHHIHSDLVTTLKNEFNIKAVFIGRENEDETLDAITNNSQQDEDWVIVKTKDQNTYPLIAKMLSIFSSKVKENAEKNNYSYYSMSPNFKVSFEKVLKDLIG